MIPSSIHSRLGREQGDGEILWITVMGFGSLTEALQCYESDDMVAALVSLVRGKYTASNARG